jgi:chitinase
MTLNQKSDFGSQITLTLKRKVERAGEFARRVLPRQAPRANALSPKESKTMFRISAYSRLLKSIAITMLVAGPPTLTRLCYGQSQANFQGPPHNVIYWNGDTSNGQLQTLASSAYTDVIVNFVVPDSNCNLSAGDPNNNGNLPGDIVNSIQTLHQAGKTVLVSFGDANSAAYKACYFNGPPAPIASGQLYTIVRNNGFDGVDIDFEDTSAFKGQAGYDGVAFLTQITNQLHDSLPQWSIITHTPLESYWLQSEVQNEPYIYPNPPYAEIFWNTGQNISWFNVQTYNDCYEEPDTDCTAQEKEANYQSIVNNFGVPSLKLVVGVPVSPDAANGGDGYIPLSDPSGSGNDVSTLIGTLDHDYPSQFGGVMGWNYLDDVNDDNGNWSRDLAFVLGLTQGSWVGFNAGTTLCLDTSNYNANNGNVYTDTCNGTTSQNWSFSVNTIVDSQTGFCLDSNYAGQVYTDPCNTGNFQNWEFFPTGFGTVIFDRQTRLCLQDNNGTVVTAPCDINNVNQYWGPNNGN